LKLSERCYAVTGLGYLPPWTVNAGFIVGEETTLIIDAGANGLAAATIHGYASAVRPSNRIMVLNTEKHFDHIGGNSWFIDRGCEVLGHAGIHRTEEEFRAETAEFNGAIASRARRTRNEERVFYHQTRLANPTRTFEADTTLELGGCAIEVLLTPGHTNTNVCVWEPQGRVLYTGDCLISRYLPNLDAGTKPDWQQWLESLDRLEHLRPQAVLAGHGPVVTGNDIARMIATVRAILKQSIAGGQSPTA
jgi:glyoxylase-like metal-dependent hydrolase (beta-lactamase superfamily II)